MVYDMVVVVHDKTIVVLLRPGKGKIATFFHGTVSSSILLRYVRYTFMPWYIPLQYLGFWHVGMSDHHPSFDEPDCSGIIYMPK